MSHPPDAGAGAAAPPPPHPTNRLAAETSAYLRQHMHNPVDWHPWGAEAFAKAQAEDKPLLVSIGYSACHWCHVMERESFEDPDTAAIMNHLFVNVKVDREERPDVDQIYMDTVVRLTGHGGWPLTVFCTPDGRPFFAGTYYPPREMHGRPSFRQVMAAVTGAWRDHRDEVEKNAQLILQSLAKRPAGVASELPGTASLVAAARELLAGADAENGGFGGAPKFPTATNLDLLLAAGDAASGDEAAAAVSFVAFTAREMSRRGLYDQLGGGFHRYCVDATWTIPHFEKMLYDQGQLLRTYADAFRRRGDPELVWPIRETAAYLRREMTGPEGGFYASQDADSEGVEGKFFVWTPAQIEAVLGAERGAAFCAAYGVTPEGNFEHGTSQLVDVARRPREDWAAERAALLAERAKRIPPGTDRKRVAAWNALAISGLARAGSVLGDAALVADAVAAADFVLTRMRDAKGRLLRVWAPAPSREGGADGPGRAHVPAFLDDVAGLLEACLDLHRAGAGERFLAEALAFADDVATRFFDDAESDFFLTPSDGERLPHRPRSDHDGATPHSSGLAVLGLVRAASLAGRSDLRQLAERVIRTHAYPIERVPAAYPTLLRAAHLLEREPATAVIVGAAADPATQALAAAARRLLAPEDAVVVSEPGGAAAPPLDPAWLAGRTPVGGRPAAYLCRGTTCSLPVTTPEAFAALLPAPRRLS